MQLSNENISIYACQFEAYVEKAKVQIKFPCNYFLQWKANNGKIIVSSQNRYQANKSQIVFKEKLAINVNVLYDKINKKYLKKQSLLMINLISKSRPDQIKLVGRVAVDLSQVLNNNRFTQLITQQLEYCSVQATINYSIKTISVKQSNMHLSELDRSSFNEYMNFQSAIKPNQPLIHRINEGSSTHRDFDEQRSMKGSEDRQIRSLGRDKNKMSSPSLSKQGFTPSNKSVTRNQSSIIQGQNKMNRSNIERSNSIPNPNNNVLTPQLIESHEVEGSQGNFSFQKANQSSYDRKIMKNSSIESFNYKSIKQKPLVPQIVMPRMSINSANTPRNSSTIVDLQKLRKQKEELLSNLQKSKSQHNQQQSQITVPPVPPRTVLAQHSVILPQHPVTLPQHPIILPKQSLILPQQRSSEQHQPTKLSQHQQISANKGSSEMFSHKISQLQGSLQQKDLTIKRLQAQLQKKPSASNLMMNPSNSQSSLHSASGLMLRQPSNNRLSLEIEKSNEESKRVISLTEALGEWQTKYTKVILQTQQMKVIWKKQRDELQLTISRLQTVINMKDKDIREKIKLNQVLQNNFIQIQNQNKQKLAETIWLKSELSNAKQQKQLLLSQKQKAIDHCSKLQNDIKFLQQLSSQNQNQLNQSFADRLGSYQKQIQQLQAKLKQQQKSRQSIEIREQILKRSLSQIQLQLSQVNQKLQSSQQDNTSLNLKLQQVHCQIFKLNQQKEHLIKELELKSKQIESVTQKLSSSKSQQLQHFVRKKQQQINALKQHHHNQLSSLTAQHNKKLEQLLQLQQHQQSKLLQRQHLLQDQYKQSAVQISNLQNTILSVSEQLSQYQLKIKSLTAELDQKKLQLSNATQRNITQKTQTLEQHHQKQQLLLNLGRQLETLSSSITNKDKEIEWLNSQLMQKEADGEKYNQELQSHRSELQITKAKSEIYQRKLQEQQRFYQIQLQQCQAKFTEQYYQLEAQLESQFAQYSELQQIKQLLKQSLEEWKNKCSQDKINNSKMVSRLNDMIREKQEVMNQMEMIMKQLEKEKAFMQQDMINRGSYYQLTVNKIREKQLQIRSSLEQKQLQFLRLYELVKAERQQLQGKIKQHQSSRIQNQQQIIQLRKQCQQYRKSAFDMKQMNNSLQNSLKELNLLKQRKQSEIIQQHNQQLQQYQQRIKQLETIIRQLKIMVQQQKQTINKISNDLLEKQLLNVDYQKQKQGLIREINQYKNKIHQLQQNVNNLTQSKQQMINKLNQNINQLNSTITSKQLQLQQAKATNQLSLEDQSKLQQLNNQALIKDQLILEQSQKYNQLNLLYQQSKTSLQNKIKQLQQQVSEYLQNIHNLQVKGHQQLQQLVSQNNAALQQTTFSYQAQLQLINHKLVQTQQRINKLSQIILQKQTQITNITTQKQSISAQLQQLKSQRQTYLLINFKQQVQKYRLQIKQQEKQLLQLKNQVNKISSLQRTIKIKNIQLSSLKFKSTNSYSSQPVDTNQVSHVEEIIDLKNEEIEILKKQNQKIKDLELQLYQVESLNQSLYQDIEQYEEEKFHLNSQRNQYQIKIAELAQQVQSISNTKNQLKQKNHQLQEKLIHYETLILDYKGHQISSTQSQSDKLNHSENSSNKIIPSISPAQGQSQSPSEPNYKIQVQTYKKKVKSLETEIQKYKAKQDQFKKKQQQHEQVILQLDQKIKLKQQQLFQKASNSPPPKQLINTPSVSVNAEKPKIQFRNPQQMVSTLKQIQSVLKKRNQFHNLQTTLIKLFNSNNKPNGEEGQKPTSQGENGQKLGVAKNKAQQLILLINGEINKLTAQFQSVKTKIMKLEGRNYQQKAKLISLLNPCMQGVKQITKLVQTNQFFHNN